MNPSTWRWAATAVLLLGVSVVTQAQQSSQPSKDPKPSASTKDERGKDNFRVVKIQQYSVLLAKGLAKICIAETQATCLIEMQIITFDGRDYCLAVAPDVMVKTQAGGSANKKNVVWALSHSALGGRSLAFHSDSGIVLIKNEKTQIEKGGAGNGTPTSPPNAYHVKTKRDAPGAEAAYLPVIIWDSDGKEELCAAIDPKIVNVN